MTEDPIVYQSPEPSPVGSHGTYAAHRVEGDTLTTSVEGQPFSTAHLQPHRSLNGHAPIMRLSALDRLFEATGEVVVQCGAHQLTLPIQSIDLEVVETLTKDRRPIPKLSIALVRGKREEIVHDKEPEYLDKLAKFNRVTSYVFVLCGLRCEITDRQDRVVWNADNSIHEIDPAIESLKAQGIVDNQLVAILNAINALTQVVEEEQVGESEPFSG